MFKPFHIDTFPVELNAFQLQSRSLFVSGGTAQLDLPSGADNAMPRQLVHGVGA
jgi:hypothetical protein